MIGTFVKMTIGGVVMVGETSNSFTSTANMIETSSKVSGRKSAFEYGRINRNVSVESIAGSSPDATKNGFDTAFSYQEDGTKVPFQIAEYGADGLPVVGSLAFSGMALVSDISQDNPDDDVMTFSLSLQVDEGSVECSVLGSIRFVSLEAVAGATTGSLTLTFSAEPTGIAATNIEVIGATKGTLTGTGVTRTLAISAITVANGEEVEIRITPFGTTDVVPNVRKVEISKA